MKANNLSPRASRAVQEQPFGTIDVNTPMLGADATKNLINTTIESTMSVVWRFAGSKNASQLTSDLLVAGNEGCVYNMLDDFTTTSLFLEGVGREYPAGTNVAVVEATSAVYVAATGTAQSGVTYYSRTGTAEKYVYIPVQVAVGDDVSSYYVVETPATYKFNVLGSTLGGVVPKTGNTTIEGVLSEEKRDYQFHGAFEQWREVQPNFDNVYYSHIAYGNGVIVAIDAGNHLAWYSTNKGLGWYQLSGGYTPISLAFGNGVFVMGFANNAGDGSGFAYSYDGVSWNVAQYDSNIDTGSVVFDFLTFTGGYFIGGGFNEPGDGVYYSQDGIHWHLQIIEDRAYVTIHSACHNGKVFVVNCWDSESDENTVLWSVATDQDWRSQNGTMDDTYFAQDNLISCNGVFYAGAYFPGSNTSDVYHSYDGDSWTPSENWDGDVGISKIVAGPNGFMIKSNAQYGGLYVSSDGKNWNSVNINTIMGRPSGAQAPGINDICYGDGWYICATANGHIISRTPNVASSWQWIEMAEDVPEIFKLSYVGNVFVGHDDGTFICPNYTSVLSAYVSNDKLAEQTASIVSAIKTTLNGQRNIILYSGTFSSTAIELSPEYGIYRCKTIYKSTSTAEVIPTPSLDKWNGIPPMMNGYFCFELEVSVPSTSTATVITAPYGWTFLEGGELPTSDFVGKTLYIACRMDLTEVGGHPVIASVWRIA